MSSIDPGMQDMLEAFIAESTSLLDELDGIMLESEKSKKISERHINEIFRIMHTIKGSAAMMGLEQLSNFSHVVEDVFFIIRQTPSKLNLVMDTIFDLLFQASDYIKSELDAIQGGSEPAINPQALIEKLEAQAAIMNGEAAPETPVSAESSAPSSAPVIPAAEGKQTVRVFFDDDCPMVTIRAFMLLSQLKDYCEELTSIPEHPEANSDLAPEIHKNGLILQFKTSDSNAEEVFQIIANGVNVKSYEMMDSTQPSAAEQPAAAEPAKPEPAAEAAAPAQAEPAAESKGTSNTPKIAKQSLINVHQSKLDQLMDLVGEIVTAESMVASNPDLKGLQLDNFYKSTRELRKLTDELQDVVMSIRMVPISGTFQKMNRIVRDMSKKLGKSVELVTYGGDTEIDKTINDALGDPFMHMIRNSVDHAIESPEERRALGKDETGKVTLSAQNIGGEIVITIADDGCGLDPAKLLNKAKSKGLLTKPEADYTSKEIFNLIMMPGFSTNNAVTEYSGRGVGMDVVRKNIETVGGTILIDSKVNEGTTFTIKIPLTLAVIDGMELRVGDTIFTLPITSIKQSFKISDASQIIHNTDNSEMIMLRGDCYPLIRLHEVLSIEPETSDLMQGIVLLIEYGDQEACIFADELIGEQQVVVKPFPAFLNKYNIKASGLSGCTILGDGSISRILDANNLLKYCER